MGEPGSGVGAAPVLEMEADLFWFAGMELRLVAELLPYAASFPQGVFSVKVVRHKEGDFLGGGCGRLWKSVRRSKSPPFSGGQRPHFSRKERARNGAPGVE